MIESFHLGAGPSVAAIARHPAELTAAARFAVDLRVADFLSIDSLARSFSGCSAVVHAARPTPSEMKRVTSTLCRSAAQAGVRRIVFLSSADVHGPCPAPGTNEKSPLPRAHGTQHPFEPTGALALAERQFLSECRQLNLAGYVLRAGITFGPRSDAIASLAVALENERACLLQHGAGICNSLYVDNLITAVRLALKAKSGAGSTFLVTDAETITWRDFYHTAARELGLSPSSIQNVDEISTSTNGGESDQRKELVDRPRLAQITPATPASADLVSAEMAARQLCGWKLPNARAAAELGYEAPVSFAEGMRRSFAWWRFAQGNFFAAA
jgi:2-alkyl-3-oxoalkanoate reductase